MASITAPVMRPAFTSELIQGDVAEVLSALSDACAFDVIIIDPPYNIGKDFGNTTDQLPLPDYLAWTRTWLPRCLELLDESGVAYVYGFAEILARVAAQFPVDEQRWLVWHYTNKAVPSVRFWQRAHESILCLWKPGRKRPEIEIEQLREPYTKSYLGNIGRPRKDTAGRYSRGGKATVYNDNGGALPRDVIKVPALAGGAGAVERWFWCYDCEAAFPPTERGRHRNIMRHPTQKPMALTRRLLRSRIVGSSGRVLIPFAGSGSECVVAAQMQLDWLGVEINPDYVRFAKEWIRQCTG